MNVSVMIKDCEKMRARSVHVVTRHAIVEVQCVNVVIGVHIVVLCVLLVVVRVVPIIPCCDAVVHLTRSRSHSFLVAIFSRMFCCIGGIVFTPPRRLQ